MTYEKKKIHKKSVENNFVLQNIYNALEKLKTLLLKDRI